MFELHIFGCCLGRVSRFSCHVVVVVGFECGSDCERSVETLVGWLYDLCASVCWLGLWWALLTAQISAPMPVGKSGMQFLRVAKEVVAWLPVA